MDLILKSLHRQQSRSASVAVFGELKDLHSPGIPWCFLFLAAHCICRCTCTFGIKVTIFLHDTSEAWETIDSF